MQGVSETLEGHVEGSVPANYLRSGCESKPVQLAYLSFGSLSHVCWLIQLPNLGLWHFVAGVWHDVMVVVIVCLVIADILVGEFVLKGEGHCLKGIVCCALSFGEHHHCEHHDPPSRVEVSNGKLNRR